MPIWKLANDDNPFRSETTHVKAFDLLREVGIIAISHGATVIYRYGFRSGERAGLKLVIPKGSERLAGASSEAKTTGKSIHHGIDPGGVADNIRTMGSTYASLHCHVVFSTKDRLPLIDGRLRSRFHDYIGGTIRGLDAYPESVGGVADHVHLLFGYRPSHRLSDLVRELKKQTSKWAQENINSVFAWQEGYAVFSVSVSGISSVKNYVATQEQHHQEVDFLQELREMLIEAGVPFDEKYLM